MNIDDPNGHLVEIITRPAFDRSAGPPIDFACAGALAAMSCEIGDFPEPPPH